MPIDPHDATEKLVSLAQELSDGHESNTRVTQAVIIYEFMDDEGDLGIGMQRGTTSSVMFQGMATVALLLEGREWTEV